MDTQRARLAKAKLIKMRRFIDFNYDLRKKLHPASIRKIERYYSEFSRLTIDTRNVHVYRPKSKKRLRIAQKTAQHNPKFKFNVAFLPTDSAAKIRWRGDKLVISGSYGSNEYASFDPKKLASDPRTEVLRAISEIHESDIYYIQAGNSEIKDNYTGDSAEIMARQVVKLQGKYSDPESNHHWENWLWGVRGVALSEKYKEQVGPDPDLAYAKQESARNRKAKAPYETPARKKRKMKQLIMQWFEAMGDGDKKAAAYYKRKATEINESLPLAMRTVLPWQD
jgi:hypothetical protein